MGRNIQGFKVKVSALPHLPLLTSLYTLHIDPCFLITDFQPHFIIWYQESVYQISSGQINEFLNYPVNQPTN